MDLVERFHRILLNMTRAADDTGGKHWADHLPFLGKGAQDWEQWWQSHWARVGELLDGDAASGEARAPPLARRPRLPCHLLSLAPPSRPASTAPHPPPAPRQTPAATLLVTHTPPHGVLDIVGGVAGAGAKSYVGRVGCKALYEMLRGLRRKPLLHAFGHVHAVQARAEAPEGPRLCAAKHVAGGLFANVAAERQLPVITGYRLARRVGERKDEQQAGGLF